MIFKKGFWWSPEPKIRENIVRKNLRLGVHSTQILMLSKKKLFVESKSGKLDVPKEEFENHLRMTYPDDLNLIPIPPLRDLPKSHDPTVIFNDSVIKLKEVWDFLHKARAGGAPSMNGISYNYIKTAHVSSGNSLSSFSRFGRRVLYHRKIDKPWRRRNLNRNLPIIIIFSS